MKSNLLKTLLAAFLLSLSACGGGSKTASTPTTEPAVIKKTINVDNISDTFSIYLLYRYRLSTELKVLREFAQIQITSSDGMGTCPRQGTIQQSPPGPFGRLIYNSCQTAGGTIMSGSIELHTFAGTAKTTSLIFTDLSYQLADDTELQKLSGTYGDNPAFPRSIDTTMSYTNGTRTSQYKANSLKISSVEISTTAISGNQHFVLTDLDDKGNSITPVLSADDGSNLSVSMDNAGAASLVLRNDVGGKIITTKNYTKGEIDDLLIGIRRAKK